MCASVYSLPYKVATEYEAEHKDKDACPKDHHVDVERQILKRHRWHSARLIGEDQSQTAEAPYTKSKKGFDQSQAAEAPYTGSTKGLPHVPNYYANCI